MLDSYLHLCWLGRLRVTRGHSDTIFATRRSFGLILALTRHGTLHRMTGNEREIQDLTWDFRIRITEQEPLVSGNVSCCCSRVISRVRSKPMDVGRGVPAVRRVNQACAGWRAILGLLPEAPAAKGAACIALGERSLPG